MKISELRKMSDKELEQYIKRISNGNICNKCGEFVSPDEKKNIYINIYGERGTMQRKLCSLCNDCYVDMLDYLGVSDINWEE